MAEPSEHSFDSLCVVVVELRVVASYMDSFAETSAFDASAAAVAGSVAALVVLADEGLHVVDPVDEELLAVVVVEQTVLQIQPAPVAYTDSE